MLGKEGSEASNFAEDIVVGALVRSKIESNVEWLNKVLDESADISALRRVSEKAEKLYLRTRNSASSQSARRAKEVVATRGWMQLHPVFGDELGDAENARAAMLAKISGFKPQETIFEVGAAHKGRKSTRSEAAEVMKTMRERYGSRKTDEEEGQDDDGASEASDDDQPPAADVDMLDDANPFDDESDEEMDGEADGDSEEDDDDELEVTVSNHATSKKAHDDPTAWQDPEVFMSYTPRTLNAAEERGYGVHSGSYKGGAGAGGSFMEAARDATMDLTNDEGAKSFGVPTRAGQRWDKKSARYVNVANDADGSRDAPSGGGKAGGAGGKTRMIRGESGVKIAASFQSGRFDKWKRAQRIGRLPRVGEQERVVRAALPAAGDTETAGGVVGGSSGGPRYKHKQDKAPKAADKYRDDYEVRKRRVAEAKEKRVGRFRDGPGSRREIKSGDDIRKARQLQEKRREKNARPSSSAGKKRGGKR